MATTLAISNRQLATVSTPRDRLETTHLEAVRDALIQRNKVQEPLDIERSPSQMLVDFTEPGRAKLHLPNRHGELGDELLLTENGLRQLGAHVLPSRGVHFLEELAGLGEGGRKAASITWGMFSQPKVQPRMLRTIEVEDPKTGQPVRAVRAAMSQDFAVYDNLNLVNDLLNNLETRNLPVLSYHETDHGIRLRMALDETEALRVDHPTRMLEAWNSEVGLRSAGLLGGIFKLWCTNGCGTWDSQSHYRWVHRGDAGRISQGVGDAIEELEVAASGVLDAYNRALNVAVDDAWEWMRSALKADLTGAQIERSGKALMDPTSRPNGGTLAGVVDAVTLAAQNEGSLYGQFEMERAAARVMRRGLDRAVDGRLVAA